MGTNFSSLSGTQTEPFTRTTMGNSWGGGTASQLTVLHFNTSNQVPTAVENRPINLAVNFFIKINNDCN